MACPRGSVTKAVSITCGFQGQAFSKMARVSSGQTRFRMKSRILVCDNLDERVEISVEKPRVAALIFAGQLVRDCSGLPVYRMRTSEPLLGTNLLGSRQMVPRLSTSSEPSGASS